MTSAVEKMKEHSRQWAEQLPITGRFDDPLPVAQPAKLWVSSRGNIIIDASMHYMRGNAFVLLMTKYEAYNFRGMPYINWRKEYTEVPKPRNKKERQELLRNMATMRAMQLGYPHKLRSKV